MGSADTIAAIQAAFASDQLLLPGSERYEKRNGSYLSQLESDIKPAAIFQPRTREEVSQFVKLIKPLVADGKATFAIRACGNMPAPGCANVEGGITLDLGLLSELSLGENTVSVGAGVPWAAVNETVQAAGRGVTGGRAGKGGIGGLALAGGLSFFSSREGFICDNVVSFEVVLASGEIVNANAKENPDLWKALKGGSNNFGIVTKFELLTFKQGPFWGGNIYYFPPSFPSQIDALVNEIQKPNADPETHLMVSIGYAAQFGGSACMNTVYYTKEGVEDPPVLKPFTAIEPQIPQLNSLKTITLTEAAAGQDAGVSLQTRCAYMNLSVTADVATLKAASDIYMAAVEPIKDAAGLICSFTLQPYAVSLLEESVAKGGNSLGLLPKDGPVVSVLLLTYWASKDDDERIIAAFKGALEKIRAVAQEKGSLRDYVYLNYSFNFQDPIGSYGEDNQRALREAGKKYDPEGLFRKGVPGGFKFS